MSAHPPVIGYYVHHVGRGHLRHAQCLAEALGQDVTGLSSLVRPDNWRGDWIELERDDRAETVTGVSAHGQLHWAPLHDQGLSGRMARIANWIVSARPAVLVVDVSVEVALFARLMGIPVIVLALPGDRHDPAHRLGYSVADAVLAPWPPAFSSLNRELGRYTDRTHYVGAMSRFSQRPPERRPATGQRRVLVLQGGAGTAITEADITAAGAATPQWDWQRLGPGAWCEDPWPALCSAEVIITHAGLGAIADVAAAGASAIIIAQDRPHGEQHATARALAAAGLALAVARWPPPDRWPDLLANASRLGGAGWTRWPTDGAARGARVVEHVAQAATSTAAACASL